jgi:hypothetical protein
LKIVSFFEDLRAPRGRRRGPGELVDLATPGCVILRQLLDFAQPGCLPAPAVRKGLCFSAAAQGKNARASS